jgi:hypothetical protein
MYRDYEFHSTAVETLASVHDEIKHAGIPAEHCKEAEQS